MPAKLPPMAEGGARQATVRQHYARGVRRLGAHVRRAGALMLVTLGW